MFGLGLIVGALFGFGITLYINDAWYKECLAIIDYWTDYALQILYEFSEKEGEI